MGERKGGVRTAGGQRSPAMSPLVYGRLNVFVAEPASGRLVGKPIIGTNPSVCDVLEVEVIIPRGE
eukprot:scaffold13894_cov106-Isochrysis_galbana.AAC.1